MGEGRSIVELDVRDPAPNPSPPNSGVPELGTKVPKSDASDFGWGGSAPARHQPRDLSPPHPPPVSSNPMNPDWPKTETASARDGRWMAHVLACPHEKCREARSCRMRWSQARRCPARTAKPPKQAKEGDAEAALLASVNLELNRIAFENDDQSRDRPVGHPEHRRRIAVAFERARKGI